MVRSPPLLLLLRRPPLHHYLLLLLLMQFHDVEAIHRLVRGHIPHVEDPVFPTKEQMIGVGEQVGGVQVAMTRIMMILALLLWLFFVIANDLSRFQIPLVTTKCITGGTVHVIATDAKIVDFDAFFQR